MTPGGIAVCSGRAYWPLATCPCPFLAPSPSAGGGAHRPLIPSRPPSPCLAYPHSPTHPLRFARSVVPTEPPDCPCFTAPCRLHTEEGHWPSPLARCVQADARHSRCRRWGTPPQRQLLGPRMSTRGRGHFPDGPRPPYLGGGALALLLPTHSPPITRGPREWTHDTHVTDWGAGGHMMRSPQGGLSAGQGRPETLPPKKNLTHFLALGGGGKLPINTAWSRPLAHAAVEQEGGQSNGGWRIPAVPCGWPRGLHWPRSRPHWSRFDHLERPDCHSSRPLESRLQ